jgi:hypothetical protein
MPTTDRLPAALRTLFYAAVVLAALAVLYVIWCIPRLAC